MGLPLILWHEAAEKDGLEVVGMRVKGRMQREYRAGLGFFATQWPLVLGQAEKLCFWTMMSGLNEQKGRVEPESEANWGRWRAGARSARERCRNLRR